MRINTNFVQQKHHLLICFVHTNMSWSSSSVLFVQICYDLALCIYTMCHVGSHLTVKLCSVDLIKCLKWQWLQSDCILQTRRAPTELIPWNNSCMYGRRWNNSMWRCGKLFSVNKLRRSCQQQETKCWMNNYGYELCYRINNYHIL